MAHGSEDGRRIVVTAGGVEAIAFAIQSYPDDESVQNWGAEAMATCLHQFDGTELEPLQGPGRDYGSVLARARAERGNTGLALRR